jgi:pyridoxal phosphate enzyme (YggS family)
VAVSGPFAAGLLADRLAALHGRMREAAEDASRDPSSVRLLAVTKGQPVGAIEAALSLGLFDIGESRVQEAQAKHAALAAAPARWHMVGHLQRNKARAAAALFDVVQSVDSAATAAALDRHRPPDTPALHVLIEVELTGLPSRSGVAPTDASPLLGELITLKNLEPVGLMTIAPPGSPAAAAECFARLRVLRDQLRDRHAIPLPELSMGMSDDFEIAIANGATLIRIGTALFGERPPPGRRQGPQLS